MSFFKHIQSRQIQKKANSFIKSLGKKSEKEIEQIYLDNKEFENNEIVLSYLFFKHPSLIRILPLEFQISRINSNLSMFRKGSEEARKELVSLWLKDNKFFMNANAVQFTEDEYNKYLKIYFQQPEDVAKLYMDDLRRVISLLSKLDYKKTEEIIIKIKDDLTDRQWEFIIEACPMLIKYSTQSIQNKYADDEKYNKFINGSARKIFVENQMSKIKEDISNLNTSEIDVKTEYIKNNPYMINYVDQATLLDLLKYDIDLIRFVSVSAIKENNELILGLLENIEIKSEKEIINIFINKGLFNAKGKLYRFDSKSEDISYQYTKILLKLIQKLNINQMVSLIMIDVNYCMPYVTPIYNDSDDREVKEKIIIDANSRCLNLFKAYYGEEIYDKYYKVINKIYNEYLSKIEKYNYEKDYNCILELFKILFNKKIITKNSVEKITVFIGMSLLYKSGTKQGKNNATIKLLTDIINTAYDLNINIDKELYDFNSLEMFDERLNFIDKKLLEDYFKYNFVNISSLLFIVKTKQVKNLFEKYYNIMINIFGSNKEALFKAVENFHYNIGILRDIDGKELTEDEEDNLLSLLASYNNSCNITKKEQLDNYEIIVLKKLVSELSTVKDEEVFDNLISKYLFNRGYNQKGNTGLLEIDTIKEICEIYDFDYIKEFEIDNQKIFTREEIDLLNMIKLLFTKNNTDILLSYIEDFMGNKIKRNILSVISLFNKLKKYKIEIINNQIVTLDDIELLSIEKPTIAKKSVKNDVVIYSIFNQNFRVFCSLENDGVNYLCIDTSKLGRNCYGYNKLVSNGSVRFSTKDKVYIKLNKDNINCKKIKPDFIIVTGKLTDEIINIAKKGNFKIVEIRDEIYE